MPQVDVPSYKLLLKKDKAHDMDINTVQWNPKVNYSSFKIDRLLIYNDLTVFLCCSQSSQFTFL